MNYFIYLLRNEINGHLYVGMTGRTIEERIDQHLYNAIERELSGHLYNAIRKYGQENFSSHQIHTAKSKEKALEVEQKWISYFAAYESENHYNMTPGGEVRGGEDHPAYGRSHTQKDRQKIRDANAKLSPKEAAEVKWLVIESNWTQSRAAEKYNVVHSTVSSIVREANWAGITPKRPEWYEESGCKKPKKELKRERASKIKWLAENTKWTQREIAARMNVSRKTISDISTDRTWGDVAPQRPEWITNQRQLILFQ